jgi:hypothetical protein
MEKTPPKERETIRILGNMRTIYNETKYIIGSVRDQNQETKMMSYIWENMSKMWENKNKKIFSIKTKTIVKMIDEDWCEN